MGTATDGNGGTHGVSGGVDYRNGVPDQAYVGVGAVGGNGHPVGIGAGVNGGTYCVSSGVDYRNCAVTAVIYVGLGAVGGNGHPHGTAADANGCAHGVSGGRLAPRPSVNLS